MKTIKSLKQDISKHQAEYERAHHAHAALAAHETPAALLEAVALTSSLTYPQRDAIALALITEHQRSRHPLWQMLLLAAYEPMLCNVRRRMINGDDGNSRVILAFLEAVHKIDLAKPPSCLALYLRHTTERAAFGNTADRSDAEHVSIQERTVTVDPFEALERDDRRRKVVEELVELVGDEDEAREVLDVLLVARTGREPLEDFIASRYPGLPRAEREAVYRRLQRHRDKALAHLRRRLGRSSFGVANAA